MYCSNCGYKVDSQPVCPQCGADSDHPVPALQITPTDQTARAVEVDAGETSGDVLEIERETELVDEFEYVPEIDFRYPSMDML
jgi:hypothetical protein